MGRAARTSISAASAATGFSGFLHAAAPSRSTGCPALSASPPRGAAIQAGGSAAGLWGGGGVKRWGGRVSPRGSGLGGGAGCSLQCLQLLYAHRGLDPGVRTGGPCLRLPRPVPQTLWLIMESSAPERRGEPEPQFGHPREANWAPPPSPPTTSPAPAAGSCASRSC